MTLRHLLRATATLLLALACQSCGTYPATLESKADVTRASASTRQIAISSLPVENYGSLARFRDLEQITLAGGGSDEKLLALSRVGLPKLADISLLNCPAVSDAGMKHLTRIRPLRMLQLEGTSITDAGLRTAASGMKLTGINVANCPKVSVTGILTLAHASSLTELGFSADQLTQAQVLRIVRETKTAKYIGIIDRRKKLDEKRVEAAGANRGIQVVIADKGAMQYIPGH